jgi:hypothetical protein
MLQQVKMHSMRSPSARLPALCKMAILLQFQFYGQDTVRSVLISSTSIFMSPPCRMHLALRAGVKLPQEFLLRVVKEDGWNVDKVSTH